MHNVFVQEELQDLRFLCNQRQNTISNYLEEIIDDTSPEKQVQTFIHEQVLRLSGTLSILENLHNDV